MGTSSFVVENGSTLTGTAAKLTGLTSSGSGTTTTTALQSTLAADLSGLQTTTAQAAFVSGADAEFTGNLGKSTTTFTENNTVTFTGNANTAPIVVTTPCVLSVAAAKINGITVTGNGTIAITALHSSLAGDLSNIGPTTITIAGTAPFTYTGSLPSSGTVTLGGSGAMTVTGTTSGAQAAGLVFNGSGKQIAVEVSASEASDFSTMTGTCNQLVTFTGNNTFTGSLALGGGNTNAVAIANGVTVTMTAARASGRAITGTTGSMVITALNDTLNANLSLIALTSGTVTIVNSATGTFTGSIKSASGTIILQIDASTELTLAETDLHELLTYTDTYGSANKTTGRRPGKVVTKTGDGILIMGDAGNATRENISISGGTVTFTDVNIVDDINADGRPVGGALTIAGINAAFNGSYTRQTEFYQLEGNLATGGGVFKAGAYYYFVKDDDNTKIIIYSDADSGWRMILKVGADFRASAISVDDAIGALNVVALSSKLVSRTYENNKAQLDADETGVSYSGGSDNIANGTVFTMVFTDGTLKVNDNTSITL
jgi:hypothetical protein